MPIPPHKIRWRLEMRQFVSDLAFDEHLPDRHREVSSRYWTPLDVSRQVAAWLTEAGARNVLDVGAGVGKFCLATAMSSDLTVIGVERRAHLVGVARALARSFELEDQVVFLAGEPDPHLLRAVDAVYLFNPFEENLFGREHQLDQSVDLNVARYSRDIEAIESMLDGLSPGRHVVTYNGFGGYLCGSYELRHRCTLHHNTLRMWTMTDKPARDLRWRELSNTELLVEEP